MELIQRQAQRVNEKLIQRVREHLKKLFPIEVKAGNKVRTLELKDVKIELPDIEDLEKFRNLKVKDGSWTAPVRGRLVLKENGKVIDEDTVTIMHLPVMTPDATLMLDGTEYVIPIQLRLKPGVYTRYRPDGTLQAKVNVLNGENFRIELDPEKGSLRLVQGGKSFKLIPFLRALGITDEQMKKAWGADVFEFLRKNSDGGFDVNEYLKRARSRRYADVWQKLESSAKDEMDLFRKYINQLEIDPEVAQLTIGQNVKTLSGKVLLQTVKKLLDIAAGKDEPSNMQSLLFKKALGPVHLIDEKLNLADMLVTAAVKDRIFRYNKVKQILPPGYANRPVHTFVKGSSISQALEEHSPISLLSNIRKVTLTGEGAIEEDRAVTNEDRALDPYSLAFIDPVHTPESEKIGANLHLALNTSVPLDEPELRGVFYDVKNKKLVKLRPIDLYNKYVAFAKEGEIQKDGSVKWNSGKVRVLYRGKIMEVPPQQVDYLIPAASAMFDVTSNLLPFLESINTPRAMMASKHLSQAVPLANPEEPLVQVATETGDDSIEQRLGERLAVKAKVDGIVEKVTDKEIVIKDANGKRHSHKLLTYLPASNQTFFHHKPIVQKGDKVKKGQVIADMNITKKGTLAMGANLRVAYMPYKGYNFEDGIVISESAAKKLASEHLYKFEVDLEEAELVPPDKFTSLFYGKFTKDDLSPIGPDGVAKKGATIKPGQPVILAIKKPKLSLHEKLVGEKRKQVWRQLEDASLVWDGVDEGTVVDVVKTPKSVKVLLKVVSPLKPGDKIVGRHGNKGTIGLVVPDEEMPKDEQGRPIEVIMNPHGVPSRINPSQILETLVGKVAEKTGQTIRAPKFSGKDNVEWVKRLLRQHGLKDKEKLTDPTGEPIEGEVLTGVQYFVKLPQRVETKTTIREKWGYDADLQPLRGSKEEGGARAIDPLTFYSLVSHNTRANIREMATYKAEKNDEFWLALETGKIPPAPKPTFVFDKVLAYMKAAGINIAKKGDEFIVKPLSEKDIDELNPVEIENATFLSAHKFEPERGGLFDPEKLGGLRGKRWGVITLPVPVLNPAYDDVVMFLLGLSKNELKKLKQGDLAVDEKGNLVPATSPNAKYFGGEAFEKLLQDVKQNIDKLENRLEEQIKRAKSPKEIGTLTRKLRVVQAIKRGDVDPTDFVMKRVPVLPTIFRPIYEGKGMLFVNPVNYAYRNLVLTKQQLAELQDVMDEKEFKRQAAKFLHRRMDELINAVPKGAQMEPRGLLTELAGSGGPKSGLIHSKLYKRRQELSSTGVLQNGPELDIDEIGIPEDMAWNLYKPFIIRRLTQKGYSLKQAKELVEKRDKVAQAVLEEEMKHRPVLVSRPPSLHEFNIQAFFPRITKTKKGEKEYVVRMNPLVMKGFNADNDGDTVGVFVPVTEEARQEAVQQMLPSKNAFKPGTNALIHPLRMEYVSGIYRMMKEVLKEKPKPSKKSYSSWKRLFSDWRANKISARDFVTMDGRTAPVGLHLVNGVLPPPYRDYTRPFDAKRLNKILADIARNDADLFGSVITNLKEVGRIAMYRFPVTIGLDDLKDPELKKIVDKRMAHIESLKSESSKIENLQKLVAELDELIKKRAELLEDKNGLYMMLRSGARGKPSQVRQIVAAPVLAADTYGRPFPMAIKRSYSEGLSPAEYFAAAFGGRASMVTKKMGIAEPGALNKELLVSTSDLVVTEKDHPEDPGLPVEVNEEILNRVLAEDVPGVAKKGDIITPKILAALKKKGIKQVHIKSILTAPTKDGVPATAVGIDESGDLPQIGENIGVKMTQAVTEPLTQATFNMFHTGGAAASGESLGNVMEAVRFFTRFPASKEASSAVLAQKAGRVTKIEQNPAGGWFVYVEGQRHYVPRFRKVIVKEGEWVKKGQPLTDGPVHPVHVMELRGPTEARATLAKNLRDILRKFGINANLQMTEPITRALTSTAVILDPGPLRQYFQRGDYVPQQFVDLINRKLGAMGKRDPEKALGMRVAKTYGSVMHGTKIDKSIAEELKKQGYDVVEVYKDVVKYKIVMPGSMTQALYKENFLHKLTTGRIKSTISWGAAMGERAKYVNTTSPAAAWLYGATFGTGKGGRY